jgi:PRC-barrel domain
MLENVSDPGELIGASVTGNQHTDLGEVDAVYLDDETRRPEWVAVATGMFGSHVSLLPLNEADWRDGVLHLPYTRDQVRNAPHQDPDHQLSLEDEQRLFGHYGLDHTVITGERVTGQDVPAQDQHGRGRRERDGRDEQGRGNVDAAGTRSEEPLSVGIDTPRRQGRRLQLYEVAEQ